MIKIPYKKLIKQSALISFITSIPSLLISTFYYIYTTCAIETLEKPWTWKHTWDNFFSLDVQIFLVSFILVFFFLLGYEFLHKKSKKGSLIYFIIGIIIYIVSFILLYFLKYVAFAMSCV